VSELNEPVVTVCDVNGGTGIWCGTVETDAPFDRSMAARLAPLVVRLVIQTLWADATSTELTSMFWDAAGAGSSLHVGVHAAEADPAVEPTSATVAKAVTASAADQVLIRMMSPRRRRCR
jgi:hypothetical protein